MPISARNQIKGSVVSSITVKAADELGLAEGKAVTAIIKASDVLLATD